MIYTVTLNPAVDYVVQVENLTLGKIHRTDKATVFFGGKGINVSLILNELGVPSVATGFTAGFTGEAIEKALDKGLIKSDFIRLENGLSRINVKLRSGDETDINCQGPELREQDFVKLFEKLDCLKAGDTLVLAGSVPKGTPDDIYEKIMWRLCDRGVRFVVDAEGVRLINTLKYKPFLIKPNNDELGELFGVKITSFDEALKYAELLQNKGAENVLVSLGGNGAVLLTKGGKSYCRKAVEGVAVNTVGAGDSMVAGFLAGLESGNGFEYALKLGTAAGGATAFCEGLADKEKIQRILNML